MWTLEDINKKDLECIIKKVIEETLGGCNCGCSCGISHRDPSGVMSVKFNEIKPEKFDTGKPGDNVLLKDALTTQESPRLGCGVMEMTKTTFDWTLNYDEIDYVIEGHLEINVDGRKVCADKGQIIYIPNGSKIQFCVPNYAKFMYTTYPANWAEQ